MYHVYVIQSINYPVQIYIGCTQNLKKRLHNHNSGTTAHTKKFLPFKLIVCTSFSDKDLAYNFEKYLKSGSGRAFLKKRFLPQ